MFMSDSTGLAAWVRVIERLLIHIAEETPDLLERGVLMEAESGMPHTIFLTVAGAETEADGDPLTEAAYIACERFKGDLGEARLKARYIRKEQLPDVWIRRWDLLLDLQGAREQGAPALVYTLGRSGDNPADLGAGYFY
jgi:hypothetical protein